ncbi:unnamed protein product [Calypogeia fissa]
MVKGMSPLRLFMRNPSRKTLADGIDGTSSAPDSTGAAAQSRQPLGPITETVRNPLIPVAEQSCGDPSTPRAKAKVSSHGQDKFPHLENSEVYATSFNVTPDKTASSQPKGKFTWQHRHGATAQNALKEGPPLLNTPPRPTQSSVCSDGRASNNQDTQSLSHNLRGCSTGGGTVTNTPNTGKSVGRKSSTESENGGSQSQNVTPSKAVSRSLKYGQQGSANNSGASGLTNVRSTVSQHVITRPIGNLQAVKGVLPQTTNQNFVEHHFELEEDASFWRDHNVQVIIRTRPLSNSELASQGSNRCLKQESPNAVSWLGQPESRFTFDHVAGETVTQAKLFDVAGLPMVENCMSGYNSCMFAYGQTGSGKTHTMLGDIENLDRSPSENRGMTPRVFEYLFARIQKEQECRRHEHLKFFCKCSFLEIYNEQITDLLEPSSTNLQMREDAKKGVYVENLSEVEVQCVQDVIQLLLQGAANRKVAATNMNRESSRSHSVFTCVVESKWENNSMTNSRYGRLHLVDLAGSERQKSSGAEGGRLKEAANINKSLSTLGLVIMILVDVANGKQRHVPYRDSKLTFLLQDSLGGNSKTIMIANVSPSSCCAMESLSTLKFAQRAKFIRNNAVINQDASGDVVALRQRIEELKVEVDRLRRESMLRVSSSRILALENESVGARRCADKSDASTQDCNVIEVSTLESRNVNKSQTISIANDKQLRSIEAVLAGALRREQQAEDITKKLAAEIEQLNRLVRQREEDSQCSKMMLRFREEKIRRLEGVADNVLSAEASYEDERKNLMDELQLIRGRLDRNPELTRFAMENLRLMEELRRYQEFYDGGERDVLLEEISGLRSQLLDMLDAKVGEEQSITKLLTPQKRALVPELSALERENELLLIEVKSYENELKECRNNLNSCLVANADLSRQVDELQATVKELKNERSQRQEESRELLISLDEDVPERFFSGVGLPDPQALSAADRTTAEIRLGTEELDLQKTHVEEQVLELRNQLKEAQDLIQSLSSEGDEAYELSERRKPTENEPCVAEDDAVVRQGLQDRWEKLQEIEMRHSEEITQLQLELDSMEEVLKEERQQRLLADEKIDDLSTQLSATLSKLEHAEGLAEDGLEEERKQRLLADEKIDDLSRQLSATLSQLEQAHGLAEDGLAEERQQRLVAEHKSDELRSQLTAAVSKLEEAHCVVEALEGQQLFSINELENLQSEHAKLLTKMKQQEQGEVEHQKQYHDESTLDDPALSILEKRLLRAKRGKEEAKRMNRQFQEEKASRMALDKEREVTMSEVETQAALAITTLQSEILDLREEVSVAVESEATAKLQISHLQKEVETLQQTIRELEDTNRYLSEKSDEYRNMVNEKHAQLQGLEADWESSASRLIDYLADGDKALSEAVREMDEIKETQIREISQMGDKHNVEKRDTAESVDHRIQGVQSMDGETEGKVMFPGDGKPTLLETNNLTLEDGEAMIRESEKKSVVAFLMVGELHERIRDLKSAQHRLLQEYEEAFSKEAAKDAQAATLRQQLEELRCQYTELQHEHEVLIQEREDLRQENQSSSLELDTVNELKEGYIRLEKENQDSWRAIAEKDVENGNLHRQLNENHLQSTLIADRYQVLLAAHEKLQREQVRYLEEKASKIEEREEQVRLSERKALAVLVVVQQLVESRNGLKETCVGLAKEIEDGRLLLADKQNALEAVEEKLELGSHQYKEIADQYQLLAETHVNVQQEHNRLFAEKALRLEEAEALVKLSERKAMAAFLVVEDLLERTKELKTTNACLANQISGAEVTFAEKENALAALQNELSKYSDAASTHQVLKEAHENLRQEHERLQREQTRCLKDNSLEAKELEEMFRLSEGKAMALVVVVQQLLGSRNGLKATNVGLAKEIEDGRLVLEEKQAALDTLEQKLDEGTHQCKEIAEQYQFLAETHVNLQEEHNRLFAEKALRLEEAEALVKLSERKAMAAFLVVENLLERMKELKTTNACLANQIEEADVTLAEKDNALAVLQNDKSEFSDVAGRHQVLKEEYDNLRQDYETLVQEHGLTAVDWDRAVKLSDKRAMATLVIFRHVLDGKEKLKEEAERREREIEEAQVAFKKKSTEFVAVEQKLEQSGYQSAEIADKHQTLIYAHEVLREKHEKCVKDWELERATLVSEKEQSWRDCLEQEQMVQSLLLEVQRLDMALMEAERRVSDMLTSVQALTVAKQELELENSRLVLAAREGETTFSEKELQVTAIRVDLADVQARLVAAELREESISERTEELTAATVEWEIERAVVEHAMQQLSEEKHKLRLYVNYLNLEMERREIAILENFRRSQEAWEAVEARMVTMEEELARLDKSKRLLERDMASLEAAASGDALALEEKELECLEMKRQLGTVMVQMNEMQTAIDLVNAQFAREMTNREDDKRRMEEEKRACEMQLRDEIATAELILMSTQGSVKTEVQRLDSSLKQTEYRVSEMLNGVKALTVAVEELELEKRRLVVAASQAEMQCREKEQELVATEGDLAGLRSRLMEAEVHEKSLSGQMEELTGAKVRWEVERADAKREIEEMRQEKDRLRFDLAILNAEVEEREKAIFDSFRRGQRALERVETRLTTMDQELGGLETSQRNLENGLGLLDSAATISSIVLEEKEQKYLELQRRLENAEVQLYEMQAAADAVMAQVALERENWQAEKRKMTVENDAREAELREEIAAAELKLVATEGSLKVAVETVEALGLSMKALEGEILKLTEDAKISLSKVAEKQQEVDRLRGMSIALKAECTEADDSIAALNQLREQYILAEASWRSEQELLTSKLEELEVSAGRVSKEGSGVSKNRGQVSQCLPECSPGLEDQEQFDGTHQSGRQKHDIQLLRAKISEKDRTILSAKKEMQIAIANLKEAELEMDKVHRQNHSLTQIQLENKCLIDSLSLKLKTAQEEVLKRNIKIEGCGAELQKVVGIMSDWETKMHDVEIEWRREKEALAQELTEAKLVANENRNEARALLQKFQEGQATLKEAEDLVDALVKANENAKHDALDWKNEKENLGIVQGWWMPERDRLVSKIARLETDMHTQKQDIWIMCKEAANGLVATMDVLFAVDKELYEMKNDHQQDMDHVAVDMKVLKGELVDLLYDLEGETIKSFKDMQTVVCELKSEKDRALKDFAEHNVIKEQRIAHSLQTINSQLEAAENERDKYQTELVVLKKQLEMAQTLADERDVIAAEARQAAERSNSHAEEKEEEARILERSVEELESTVFALESQLDIVKRESDRHRVAREALEKELEDLNRQMGLMQVTIDNQDTETLTEVQGAETSKTELDRIVIEMKNQQIQTRQSVESLQQECAEKDVQLRSCKAHIAELMLGAEKQASENQHKLKALEAMVEHLKVEERKVIPPGGSASKSVEKSTGKVKGAGSPFKCIGSGLEKQRSSEIDEELSAAKKRLKELESIAASRQKEVFMLNTKLAEAESMTHDVVRDLLGVKMDIASYATLLNQQQVQRIAERARRRTAEAQEKEDELDTLRDRLNEFIEERESWLEEINRRQAEAVAARVSAEKLRLRDETLTAENDKFREECHALRKRVADLEDEIKKLSGQQNLQQRIHHHAKIKEENNSIRLQNEDLSGKLRRMEILFTRVNDELARYRTAEGKTPFLNFDEEARLQKKLQETEENRLHLAETVIGLCTGIMQAAGIQRASRDLDPSAAMTALQHLEDRLESLERELSDCKLKARIAVERRRLSDLRDFHTPVKAICGTTNFTANQQLPSPVSSSR